MKSVPGMFEHAGETIDRFGLDNTGLIQYKFNQQGFRSDYEFDSCPSHAFFGCSITFGIGVGQSNTFSAKFPGSYNFGLAGVYDNRDIFNTIQEFLASDLYSPKVNIAVVWHRRDQELLPAYLEQLLKYPIHHFFCGDKLQGPRCYGFLQEVDRDVSETHPGPKSHELFYKILCAVFKQ